MVKEGYPGKTIKLFSLIGLSVEIGLILNKLSFILSLRRRRELNLFGSDLVSFNK